MGGLYILWLSDTHYYGGRAVHFRSRWQRHRRLLMDGKHFNPHAQAVYNKYGRFEPKILKVLPSAQHGEAEKDWLEENVGVPGCVNISKSFCGLHVGFRHSEETKQKFRNRRFSEETRQKLRDARRHRVFSFETCQKISRSLTGQKRPTTARLNRERTGWTHTDEAKQKISEAGQRPCSDNTKEKIQANHKAKGIKPPSFKGRRHSEATRRKMSESSKGPRTMTPEERLKRSESAKRSWEKRRAGRAL